MPGEEKVAGQTCVHRDWKLMVLTIVPVLQFGPRRINRVHLLPILGVVQININLFIIGFEVSEPKSKLTRFTTCILFDNARTRNHVKLSIGYLFWEIEILVLKDFNIICKCCWYSHSVTCLELRSVVSLNFWPCKLCLTNLKPVSNTRVKHCFSYMLSWESNPYTSI